MKAKVLVSIVGLFISTTLWGQNREKYAELTKEAFELYQAKEYLMAGKKYSDAFITLNNQGSMADRYNAACAWAQAKEIDSSFVQLYKIVQKGKYKNLKKIKKDNNLRNLHSDLRWKEVIQIVTENKFQAEKDLDEALIRKLDKILKEDQKHRLQFDKIEKKHGRNSKKVKEQLKLIHEKDSINLIEVKKILDSRGWLGQETIGKEGSVTLFLVIQHSDLETQLKYLPMLREAVKKGNAYPSDLAFLEDRVAVSQGKKQIYGSQIGTDTSTGEYYLYPLIDPANVDERRSEVGLKPLAEYLSYWNITWDIEKHIIRSKKLEARQ